MIAVIILSPAAPNRHWPSVGFGKRYRRLLSCLRRFRIFVSVLQSGFFYPLQQLKNHPLFAGKDREQHLCFYFRHLYMIISFINCRIGVRITKVTSQGVIIHAAKARHGFGAGAVAKA